MAVKWSTDKIQKAIDLWSEGKTLSQIGEILGITKNAVVGLINRNKNLFPKKTKEKREYKRKKTPSTGTVDPRLWSIEDKTKAKILFRDKLSLKEIAAELGKSKSSVASFVRRNRDLFPQELANSPSTPKKIKLFDPKTVKIEEPVPREIPVPENALNIPWIELNSDQCAWSMDTDFFVEASNSFPCCGLPVEGGKGIRRRFCSHHVRFGLKGWEDNASS